MCLCFTLEVGLLINRDSACLLHKLPPIHTNTPSVRQAHFDVSDWCSCNNYSRWQNQIKILKSVIIFYFILKQINEDFILFYFQFVITQGAHAQLAIANNPAFGWNTPVLGKLCLLSWQQVTPWHFQLGVFITSLSRRVRLWHFGRGESGARFRNSSAACSEHFIGFFTTTKTKTTKNLAVLFFFFYPHAHSFMQKNASMCFT